MFSKNISLLDGTLLTIDTFNNSNVFIHMSNFTFIYHIHIYLWKICRLTSKPRFITIFNLHIFYTTFIIFRALPVIQWPQCQFISRLLSLIPQSQHSFHFHSHLPTRQITFPSWHVHMYHFQLAFGQKCQKSLQHSLHHMHKRVLDSHSLDRRDIITHATN